MELWGSGFEEHKRSGQWRSLAINRSLTRQGCLRALALWIWLALGSAAGAAGEHSWNDRSLPSSERARMALDRMTDEEKLNLVHSVIAAPWGGRPKPNEANEAALRGTALRGVTGR